MEFMSAKEAAEKWGVSPRRVALLCAERRIAEAALVGHTWVLPVTAKKPPDGRMTRYAQPTGKTVRPFLKWAGGKGQLLPELEKYYPFAAGKITKYAEPFVGGGAVLFDILGRFDLEAVYISDVNARLINAYRMVRDESNALIQLLAGYEADYLPLDAEGRRRYYTEKRDQFNRPAEAGEKNAALTQAALMIFLNKTCFNGLYRVNRKGQFNVPIGSYKAPLICDEANLRAAAEKLKNVQMVQGDYKRSAAFIDRRTFVYFDPPYRPITQTACFTAYTESAFGDAKQRELAAFVNELSGRGAKIVVSNSDPQNADESDRFFEELYAGHTICRVSANRMINSNSRARGKINELIISNF